MGFVDSFDHTFKLFYDTFEEKFTNIKDLPDGEFLPSTQNIQINETGGFDISPKPEPELSTIQNYLTKFKFFNENSFVNREQSMKDEEKRILQYLDDNKQYLHPLLKRYIRLYLTWTLFYFSHFRIGWNYPEILIKRSRFAQEIIKILKNEKIFNGKAYKDEFIKKWQSYDLESS